MANSVAYDNNTIKVGDTISIDYKFKDGEKERTQAFRGIIVKIAGKTPETRLITVRKISKIGIGVERLIPLASPNIVSLKLIRTGSNQKAKLYFIRDLTEAEVRNKLYRAKK
jgi:large subunit ribosomal protein L19